MLRLDLNSNGMLEATSPRAAGTERGDSPMEKPCPAACCSDSYDPIVCHCLQVRESVLVEAITTLSLRTVRDVRHATGAGDGCTCCHRQLRQYLEGCAYSSSSSAPICSVK
jgi:bacterioferritin-associated ferredoxin